MTARGYGITACWSNSAVAISCRPCHRPLSNAVAAHARTHPSSSAARPRAAGSRSAPAGAESLSTAPPVAARAARAGAWRRPGPSSLPSRPPPSVPRQVPQRDRAFSPRQPRTASVVESRESTPSSTRRNSTTPETSCDADAMATRWSGEKSPYMRWKTRVPARSWTARPMGPPRSASAVRMVRSTASQGSLSRDGERPPVASRRLRAQGSLCRGLPPP